MGRKPPPMYRMARCRKCPLHCKPSLTVEQATAILENPDLNRRAEGTDICTYCHKASNDKQNKITFEKAGRDYDYFSLTPEQQAEVELMVYQEELERVEAEIAKLERSM